MSRGNGLDPVQVKNKRHEEYLNKFDKASVYDNSALRFLEQHIYHYNNLLKKIDTIG
ncbi:hypothetical protein [Psychromonas sp. KJ10-2]|uniref:hypothetical protein n=1 Tax=Psychromonas sp. KJ10-2 TaxID=3391822 RepID=UPI0039B5A071